MLAQTGISASPPEMGAMQGKRTVFSTSSCIGGQQQPTQKHLEVIWLALGGPFLFGVNGVRNKRSHLVGPSFPAFKARFSAMAGWHFYRDLSRHLLIGAWLWSESRIC